MSETTHIRFGSRHTGSSTFQLPLFMIWKEWRDSGTKEVTYAKVLFEVYPKWLQKRDSKKANERAKNG